MEAKKDTLGDKLKTIKETMFYILCNGRVTPTELLMLDSMELILEYLEEQTK